MTGRKADVIKAAHLCAEAALRLVKPGNQVSEWGADGPQGKDCSMGWPLLGGWEALFRTVGVATCAES